MKNKSLKLFLIIVVSLFVTDRLVYLILHHIEEEVFTGQSVGKANVFVKVKDSVDLLVLGSSRAARHIDPDVFSMKGYNMGMDGTHLGYAAALMATLERKGQTILVHVDHQEVYDVGYQGDDMLALLNETMDSKKMEDFVRQYYPEEIFLSKFSNCYVYNGKVLGMIKNAVLTKDSSELSNGFSPLSPSAQQKQTFQQILDRDGIFQNLEIPHPLVVNNRFESFVDFAMTIAKRNNSRLMFFTSPSLNKVDDKVRKRTADFFAAKNIKYLDDLDFFTDFNIDLWKDRSHMSKVGAKLYSKKLLLSLNEINWLY